MSSFVMLRLSRLNEWMWVDRFSQGWTPSVVGVDQSRTDGCQMKKPSKEGLELASFEQIIYRMSVVNE